MFVYCTSAGAEVNRSQRQVLPRAGEGRPIWRLILETVARIYNSGMSSPRMTVVASWIDDHNNEDVRSCAQTDGHCNEKNQEANYKLTDYTASTQRPHNLMCDNSKVFDTFLQPS
jgi:hypothetical protein